MPARCDRFEAATNAPISAAAPVMRVTPPATASVLEISCGDGCVGANDEEGKEDFDFLLLLPLDSVMAVDARSPLATDGAGSASTAGACLGSVALRFA